MASLLLIHSDAVMSDRICRTIVANDTGSLFVAGAVRTLAQGRAFVRSRIPDIVAVDLRVSDGPFVPWFDELRRHTLHPRVVVIARAPHDPELLHALRHGVDGYAIANQAPEQLDYVLREVLGGHSTMTPEIARRLQMHFAQHAAAGRALIDERDRMLLQWVSTGYGLDDIAQGMRTTPGRLGAQVRALYRKLQLAAGNTAPNEAGTRRRGAV
jgi:DNA-binding NarL/FixJ family response regulator